MCPSFCMIVVPRKERGRSATLKGAGDPPKEEGARKTGCALHPRSHVQVCAKQKRTRAYRFSGEHPAFPAQWCYDLYRALPGDRLSCHRRPREALASQELDASIGASGPHDFAVRVTRCSSKAHPRPSHSAPNVRDDRDTPLLWARNAHITPVIWPWRKAKYFFKRGWTGFC